MQGVNEFQLNEATVMEALQYWMNKAMLTAEKRVKVTAVRMKDTGYSVNVYVVTVEPLKAAS